MDSRGWQVVDVVVDGGYRPAVIHARARVPLRIAFLRVDESECTERVIFSAPRLERHLALAATTTVDLPAQPPGEVRFTCGMGRFVGRIELTDAPASLLARIRGQLERIESPLGTALLLWIGWLPLIALVALLTLDAAAAITTAGAALVAWVVGCLWAFGRSGHSGRDPATAVLQRRDWRLKRQ